MAPAALLKRALGDRAFLKLVLSLALPISLQQVISSSLQLVDVVMVGRLGEVAVASAGLASKLYGVLSLVLSGVGGGVAIFAAQYWGREDRDSIARILGSGLLFALGIVLPVTAVALAAPTWLMGLFSRDAELVASAGGFLRVVALGFPLSAVTAVFAAAARSTGSVRIPLVASVTGLCVNSVLNYLLIFGHLGLPAWGLQGAAVATVIARVVEVGLLLSVLYLRRGPAAPRLSALVSIPARLLKRFSGQALPLVLNEFFWSLGLFMYFVVYARMGTEQLAAISLVSPVESICIDLFVGFGAACAIILGRELGARRNEAAYDYALRFAVLGPVLALGVGALILLLRDPILSVFSGVSAQTHASGRAILLVIACTLWFKVFNMVACMGILRSGGDTRFVLVVDVGSIWLLGIPAAVVAGLVLELPMAWVYAIVLVEELLKFFIWTSRIVSRRWLNTLVEDAPAPLPAADLAAAK